MNKFFNTGGPCDPEIHYMLSPLERIPQVLRLIKERSYFVLHAPRQTGKTTAFLILAQQLTQEGTYAAVLLSVEVGSAFPDEPGKAERAILDAWRGAAQARLPKELLPPPWPHAEEGRQIGAALQAWALVCPRPLVLFIDEIDSLQNQVLLSVLRQLRDGYPSRPKSFPQSLALIGMRDVRDYKIASGGSDRLQTASPFNILVESLSIRNFTKEEVLALLAQHSQETGQVFEEEALSRIYELTLGQPWLVNALARQLTRVVVPNPTQTIQKEHVNQAKEILIQRQDTHLDSLAERLQEHRVRNIIEPLIAGEELPQVPSDDLRFILDLGLCRMDPQKGLVIANPIYQEVIPRVLASTPQASISLPKPIWLTTEGNLNPEKLLEAFLVFWKQHGEPLLKSAPYHEIAPHLVLMAFLHRVVNGGGSIEREYAIGSRRLDLVVTYKKVKLAMELKVWKPGDSDPLSSGLEQLDDYLSGLGLQTGWLVIFDRRPNLLPLAERLTTEMVLSPKGRTITLIRS